MLKNLKRNPALREKIWKEVGDAVITKANCRIYIPYNFLNYNLATIGEKVYSAMVFFCVSGDEYFLINTCAGATLTPTATKQVKADGTEYLEFTFVAGSQVIESLNVIKDSDLLYDLNKYLNTAGRVPPYLEHEDRPKTFLYHKEHAGLNIAPNTVPYETIIATTARDQDDKFKYYRHTDMMKPPFVVGFANVMFNTTNTTAKIIGSYLADGFTSALVSPSTSTEPLETLLRR